MKHKSRDPIPNHQLRVHWRITQDAPIQGYAYMEVLVWAAVIKSITKA